VPFTLNSLSGIDELGECAQPWHCLRAFGCEALFSWANMPPQIMLQPFQPAGSMLASPDIDTLGGSTLPIPATNLSNYTVVGVLFASQMTQLV